MEHARLATDDDEAEDREFLHGFDRIEQRLAQRGERARRVKYAKIGAAVVAVTIGIGLVAALGVGAKRVTDAPYTCTKPAGGGAFDLTFFVIGDWGRLGNGGQRTAARMMADVAGCMPPKFIVSTGDNFYKHGLKSADDPQFLQSFVNVYSAPALKSVPWYAVLGNHDYNDGINPDSNSGCAATTLDACPKGCCYSPTWQYTGMQRTNDARWHAQNGTWSVPGLPPGLADVFMLDTNPFVLRYLKEDFAANAGGIRSQNATMARLQLESLLSASKATWRFVVGHHPVASFGGHCDYKSEGDCTYMAWLAPLLQSHDVAALFSGHDHDMQLIQTPSDPGNRASDPTWPLYIVSGGGSDIRAGEQARYRDKAPWVLNFFADDQGFAAVRLNATAAVIDIYVSNHAGPAASVTLKAKPRVRAAEPRAAAAGAPEAAAPKKPAVVPIVPAAAAPGPSAAASAPASGPAADSSEDDWAAEDDEEAPPTAPTPSSSAPAAPAASSPAAAAPAAAAAASPALPGTHTGPGAAPAAGAGSHLGRGRRRLLHRGGGGGDAPAGPRPQQTNP